MEMLISEELNVNRKLAIASELEGYCATHPNSPTVTRQPHIVIDRGRYEAALGKSTEVGMFGFGTSVTSAPRCFDELYVQH
jgi:hypothetical protein